MGRIQAEGMIEFGGKGDNILTWHLTSPSQHFPPYPAEFVPIARQAIDAANEDDYDRIIELPEGVEFRDGRTGVEAWRIIESFHLDSFIEQDEVWDD